MNEEHWVWWLLTGACMVWYSMITVYVAIRGIVDIRQMLARLREKQTEDANDPPNGA